jgi:hypothetical protein
LKSKERENKLKDENIVFKETIKDLIKKCDAMNEEHNKLLVELESTMPNGASDMNYKNYQAMKK